MKKLIILLMFGSVLLTSCSKEETTDQIEQQTTDVVYVLKQSNGVGTWEATQVNLLDNNSTGNGDADRTQSAHAHGDYTGFGGGVTINFSGTENNGGTHGSAEVRQVGGPFEAHYILATTSVVVDGTEAIYGGIITEVIVNTFPPPPPPPFGPPPPCNPNSVGNYVYFKVFDNGQGTNAPTDQYQGLFQSCSAQVNGAAGFPWFIFGGPFDVENSSDKIKVN